MTLFPAASPSTFPQNIARSRLNLCDSVRVPTVLPHLPTEAQSCLCTGTVLAAGSECAAGSVPTLCTVFWGVNRLRAMSSEWVVHPPHSQQQQS